MFGFMKKNQEPSADLSTFGLLPGKKIKICSADFRDRQQARDATRFQTREILPISLRGTRRDTPPWRCGEALPLMCACGT